MSELKRNWDDVPKWAKIVLYTILGIAAAVLLGLLFGNVIRWLWNWLMPNLFGLRTIGFWEGLGLLALARILFGSTGSGNSDNSKHRKRKKRHAHDHGSEDCMDWAYYDEWWEEDGQIAFHAYAERKKAEPKDDGAAETDAK